MKLIYISHWRFPSEKTMSPLIMKTCEMFARKDIEVELWMPWRNNPGFVGVDPFSHHGIMRNFIIRRIPSLDFTGYLPGGFFFFLMLVSFYLSIFVLSLALNMSKAKPRTRLIFYFHDVRDVIMLSFLKRPMFLEIHDFYKSGVSWINHYIFPRITGFIVTNRFKMETLSREFGIPDRGMLHRPNGVDVEMFAIGVSKKEAREKLYLPPDQKIILYTGHLFDWKGVDTLFDVHRFLNENEVIYFVGGTDEDIERFKDKSEKIKDKIVVVGRRPHREIPLWFRAADVLVLPNTARFEASKYETSPVKLFEYMASGRPIVASDLPSIRNVVDESMVFFAKPDDPQSFADVIRGVLQNYQDAEERARIAQKEVAKYSWENRAEAISKFITSVA